MTKHYDALTEQQQQELLEKYDPEAGSRKLTGIVAWIAMLGLLSFFSISGLYIRVWGVNSSTSTIDSFRFCLSLDLFIISSAKKRPR